MNSKGARYIYLRFVFVIDKTKRSILIISRYLKQQSFGRCEPLPRKRDKSSRAESKTTKEYTTFRIVVVVLAVVYLIYFALAVKTEKQFYLNLIGSFISFATLVYLIIQVRIMENSLEEIRKERLTNIVVEGIGILNKIKQKIKTNFDHVVAGKFEKLEEIGEEFERPEFVIIDDLLGINLFSELDCYNFHIKKLKEIDNNFRKFLCRNNQTVKELIEKIVTAIRDEPELRGILDDPISRAEANAWPCDLAHKLLRISWYYREHGAIIDYDFPIQDPEKLYNTINEILEEFKTRDRELIQEITNFIVNIKQEAEELMFSQDEEDRKAHVTRDKRIKLIDEAIKRLKEEYVKA